MTRLRSLTARLVVTAVVLVAVVSLLMAGATTLVMRQSLLDRLDGEVAAALDRTLEGPPGPRDGPAPPDLRNQAPGTLIVFLGGDLGNEGVVVGDGPGERETVDEAVIDRLALMESDDGVDHVDLPGVGDYRVASTTVGDVAVVVGLPTDDVDDAVTSLLVTGLLLSLLAVVVAGGAAALVVRRQLRPLREVAATAHTVADLPLASGEIDLAERVPAHLTDERTEVGQVGAALDSLLSHVETALRERHRSEQQVRQFVADASHELRTPLATIAGYTELARRHPDDTATGTAALAKVEEESARMTALVEDLLLLARLDAGRPLAREPVDLTRLLLEATEDARVVAPDHRWRLELPEESVEVLGDELRLHQVVTNLLTNARKHTPPGTTVTVRGTDHGFVVADDGPGFPPGLVDSAFERFARGDSSRSRDGSSGGGAGLGLALVRAIVGAHGGHVGLASRPGRTTIEVDLPRPGPNDPGPADADVRQIV